MTSYNDVTIVCCNLLVGKPLHMHSRTTTVCLHPLASTLKIPNITESPNLIVSFPNPFSMSVRLFPGYFSVPSYCSLIY